MSDYETGKLGIDCIARACKNNENGRCKRFKDGDEFLKAVRQGGGCALTWFFTGRIPKEVEG